MASEAVKGRKVQTVRHNQIIVVTVPPTDIPRVIFIDAAMTDGHGRLPQHRAVVGVRADRDIEISNPLNMTVREG